MLTLRIVSGHKQIDLFVDLASIVHPNQLMRGWWWGKGAEFLALDRTIEPEVLRSLLLGYLPDGRQKLRGKRNRADFQERAGYHFVFSPPKSVSLSAALGEDQRLEAAHHAAVERALEVLEQRYARTRVHRGGEKTWVKTQTLLVGVWPRYWSRSGDPHLHTHCLVLNGTRLSKGKWKSICSEPLFYNKWLLAAIYRNELAYEVQQLGYEIVVNGRDHFELKGYTQDQLNQFSKRRMQILDVCGEDASLRKKEIACLETRPQNTPSQINDEDQLKQLHREAKDAGLICPTPSASNVAEPPPLEALIRKAIEYCSSSNHLFRQEKLEESFMQHFLGRYKFKEFSLAFKTSGELISVDNDGLFTTSGASKKADEIACLLQAHQGQAAPIVTEEALNSLLEGEGQELTPGQQALLTLALTTTDPVIAWQGIPSEEKTFALNRLKDIAQQRNYTIREIAPRKDLAELLATTVQPAHEAAAIKRDEAQGKGLQQIWVIEAAELLNPNDFLTLLESATEVGARVVLLSSPHQLKKVRAGNPFKFLQRAGLKTAYLNPQPSLIPPGLKWGITLLQKGSFEAGLSQLEKLKRIRETGLKGLVQDFLELSLSQQERILILAATAETKYKLLEILRDKLKAEGRLHSSYKILQIRDKGLTHIQARYLHNYQAGEIVIPVRCYQRLGLVKSQQYQVESVNAQDLSLKAGDGTSRVANPLKFRKKVYCPQPIEIAVGDRLRWNEDSPRDSVILNRTEFEVIAIDGNTAHLRYDHGTVEQINLSEAQALDHAWVNTPDTMRGKKAEQVLVAIEPGDSLEGLSPAAKSAKSDLTIYTSGKNLLEAISS